MNTNIITATNAGERDVIQQFATRNRINLGENIPNNTRKLNGSGTILNPKKKIMEEMK